MPPSLWPGQLGGVRAPGSNSASPGASASTLLQAGVGRRADPGDRGPRLVVAAEDRCPHCGGPARASPVSVLLQAGTTAWQRAVHASYGGSRTTVAPGQDRGAAPDGQAQEVRISEAPARQCRRCAYVGWDAATAAVISDAQHHYPIPPGTTQVSWAAVRAWALAREEEP